VAIVEDGGASGAYVSIISAANNVSGINFGDPSDENVGSIEYNNSDNSLTFDTGTSVDMFHIDQYGSIGMGTTSPAEKLHIVGTTDGTDPSFSTASQLLIEDQFSGGAGLQFSLLISEQERLTLLIQIVERLKESVTTTVQIL
jgi:hypothetical protein